MFMQDGTEMQMIDASLYNLDLSKQPSFTFKNLFRELVPRVRDDEENS